MFRRLSPALVALAALPFTARAQDVKLAYGPQNAKFVVSSKTKSVQEMMGQKQEGEIVTEQRYSLAATPKGAGQLDMTLALDSMSSSNTMGQPSDVSKAIGTKFVGIIATNGRALSGDVSVPTGGDPKSQQSIAMRTFLPYLPASAKVGTSWSDTLTMEVAQGPMQLKNTVVYTYTLTGDTAVEGTKAWKINTAANTTIAGKGNQQGQDLTIEGTSKGTGFAVISKDGQYLAREGAEETSLTITVDAMGLVIPVTQSSVIKMARQK